MRVLLLPALCMWAAFASSLAYCPPEKMHSFGLCSYRIQCIGAITNVKLPEECRGSPNYPVRVELTLKDASDKFNNNLLDEDFLSKLYILRASGNWSKQILPMLPDMPNLEVLYLIDDNIETIEEYSFDYLSNLKNLDLSHNHLVNIDDLFQYDDEDYKLEKLTLAYNEIYEISNDTFSLLNSLTDLDLSHNMLSDLSNKPFANLTNLKMLRLNNNKIKDLNGALNNLRNLEHLYLQHNHLRHINADSFAIINHLVTFDISGNNIQYIRPTIFLRHWLHVDGQTIRINLADNKITMVPNATSREIITRYTRTTFFNQSYVNTELNLSKNEINVVEYNAFETIARLTDLDLSNNRISDFIVNPRDLVAIRFLNLSRNSIKYLHFESFAPMAGLQNLDLSHNQLDFIPDQTFYNNNNLKLINMTHNIFKELFHVYIKMFHAEGGVLDLSNNTLSRLIIPNGEALRLTTLILCSNNITDISSVDLFYQHELKTLFITHNYIEHLDKNSLHLPSDLSYLDMSYNLIGDIGPSTFRQVSQLDTLRLSHNNLSSITYGMMQGLRELKSLDLSYNKIAYIDSKTLAELKYLQFLSLSFNGMHYIDYKAWYGHKVTLLVYVEGNNFSCDFLSTALQNYENGYSKMRPTVLTESTEGASVGGISCEQGSEMGQLVRADSGSTDERLLLNSQRILEAIKEQTYFLRKFLSHVAPINNEMHYVKT